MNNENNENKDLYSLTQEPDAINFENDGLVSDEFAPSAGEMKAVPAAPEKKQFGKKAQYRTVAAAVTVLVLVILIVLNVLVNALGTKVNTKLDLTQDRILAFSDQTKEVLAGLDKDVNVYSLIPDSNNTLLNSLESILQRYQNTSKYIKYERVDTTKNPQFVQKYQKNQQAISMYSVIFECGDKFRVINVNDTVYTNSQTGQIQSISAEQKFTAAIEYVTSDVSVKAAFTTGHGEIGETDAIGSLLKGEKYEVAALDMASEDIAEDVSLLIIESPKTDFTADEIEKLDRYFDRGGKAQVFLDVSINPLPRLEEYLKEWGVTFQPGFVVENSRNNYVQSQILLLPEILDSDMTKAIISNKLKVIVPNTRGIELSHVVGVTSQPLLRSSAQSFIRTDASTLTASMVEGDIKGPVSIAAVQQKYTNDGKNVAQLFVMGSTGFAASDITSESAYANKDFYLNVTSAMTDKKSSLSIRAKDVSPAVLAITATQALVLGAIVLIVIPIIVLVIGIAVWVRRRRL